MDVPISPALSGGPAVVEPPAGFRAHRMGGAFIEHVGPLYVSTEGGVFRLGFRVLAQHTNPLGICHGGMMATFADMLLPMAVLYRWEGERRFLPTIGLQVDYLGPSRLGAWVEGRGELLRRTRNMVFAQGLVTADGEPVLRVSGTFKVGEAIAANLRP